MCGFNYRIRHIRGGDGDDDDVDDNLGQCKIN